MVLRFTLDPNAIKLEIEEKNESVPIGKNIYTVSPVCLVKTKHVLYNIEVIKKISSQDMDTAILTAIKELEEKVYIHRLKNNHLNIMEYGTKNNK